MGTENLPIDMARAYLLRKLPDDAAQALEEEYFLTPSLLSQIQSVERQLIEDYLDGALGTDERKQFEARYLTIPVLRDLVHRIKRERTAGVRKQSLTPSRMKFTALAVAALATMTCLTLYLGPRGLLDSRTRTRTSTVVTAVVILHLEPGVSKGDGVKVLPLPGSGTFVRVETELPSLRQPTDCAAHLSFVRGDGALKTVWTSPPMRTATQGSIQSVSFPIPAARFQLGDFVLDVYDTDGQLIESYLFHVAPAK